MRNKVCAWVLCSASILALAPGALAQESSTTETATSAETDTATSAEADRKLDTIKVTARKREESLIDVPVAVSVTTAEQLKRDQIVDASDLSRTTPALEVAQTFGGEESGGGRVRGLGTLVSNRSVSPTVAFQVDQVPQGLLAFPQLFDIAQVEVLRGPQGTLFGQGASAGVVNFTTRSAAIGEGFTANIGVQYAPNGELGSESGLTIIDGGMSIPLGETAALRVSGQYRDEEGVQYNVTLNDFNSEETIGLRGKLLWEVTPQLTFDTSLEYNYFEVRGRDFFGYDNVTPPAGTPVSAPSLGNLAACGVTLEEYASNYCSDIFWTADNKIWRFSNIADYEFGDFVLTSVTSYRTKQVDLVGSNFATRSIGPAARDENLIDDSKQFTQELRLAYTADSWDLIVGAFYADYSYEQRPLIDGPFGVTTPGARIGFSVCTPDGATCPVPVTFISEDTSNQTLAAFADATIEINEQFDLFGGLRITDYSNTTEIGTPNANTIASTAETGETNVSGRIGGRYQPNADLTIYGSVATGYKPSAVVVDAALPTVFLEEETSLTFEVGAKRAIGDSTVEVNVFHTTLENFQAQASQQVAGELINTALNISEVISKGFEVTAYGDLTDYISYNVGYLYNDATYPDGFVGDDGADLSGQQIVLSPEHKFTLSGEFFQPVAGSYEWFVNANLVYKSEVLLAARDPNRFSYGAHPTFGGSVGFRAADGGWSISVFGRNIFQERAPIGYLPSVFRGQSDGGIRSWPVAGITTRLVGVKLDVNF